MKNVTFLIDDGNEKNTSPNKLLWSIRYSSNDAYVLNVFNQNQHLTANNNDCNNTKNDNNNDDHNDKNVETTTTNLTTEWGDQFKEVWIMKCELPTSTNKTRKIKTLNSKKL
jgi:hypothetical protein